MSRTSYGMNTTLLTFGIIIAVIVLAVLLFVRGDEKEILVVSPTPIETPFISESPSPTGNSTNTIIYNDTGFSPATLTVPAGTAVTFRNMSSRLMWPASAVHPTHNAYPVKGGCVGSTFDACQAIQRNSEWNFIFTEKGTWKYHDHLSPALTGTIIVQ